jgi:hypothetical protein
VSAERENDHAQQDEECQEHHLARAVREQVVDVALTELAWRAMVAAIYYPGRFALRLLSAVPYS